MWQVTYFELCCRSLINIGRHCYYYPKSLSSYLSATFKERQGSSHSHIPYQKDLKCCLWCWHITLYRITIMSTMIDRGELTKCKRPLLFEMLYNMLISKVTMLLSIDNSLHSIIVALHWLYLQAHCLLFQPMEVLSHMRMLFKISREKTYFNTFI